MADPYGTYVKLLRYAAVIPERFKYESPPPVEFSTADATFRLADCELVVTPTLDFPTVESAKLVVQPTLDAWQARSDLEYSPGEFRFEFRSHETAMRNPPPAGTVIVGTASMTLGSLTAQLTLTSSPPIRRAYPTPPTSFVLTPDAKSVHDRIIAAMEGREPIASLAYFCLTVAESVQPANQTAQPRQQSRKQAATLLAIDIDVLRKLGELSSEYGGADGRKASSTKPFTDDHHRWLVAVNLEIFERLGAYAAGTLLKQLTMNDLPKI